MYIKKLAKTLFTTSICLALLFKPTSAYASVLGTQHISGYAKQIGNGITFTNNTYFSDQPGVGQQTENYITYTPNTNVVPLLTYGTKLYGADSLVNETLRLESLGIDVLCGTNADSFSFDNGIPMSNAIIDGKIVTMDTLPQDFIAFTEGGTASISTVTFNAMLKKADGTEVPIHNINKLRQPDSVYMLTNEFSDTTRNTTGGYDIILGSVTGEMKLGTTLTAVVESVNSSTSSISIPAGKIVLSIDSNAPSNLIAPLSTLGVGETVSISFSTSGEVNPTNIKTGMGTKSERLLANGEIPATLKAGAAARTAIGIKEDGSIILYTADGHQSGYSYGLQLKALAQRMKELGCVDALNLDGGGSTTITAQLPGTNTSTLKNIPSDGKPRNVSTYLFFVNNSQQTATPAHLHILPYPNYVVSGSALQLSVVATDDGFYPVATPDNITYTVQQDKNSTITPTGLFTAKDNGPVTVYAQSGSAVGSIVINCLEAPSNIIVSDKNTGMEISSLTLEPGNTMTLTATAYDGLKKYAATESLFKWEADPEIGTFTAQTFTTSNNYGAKGNIKVSLGNKTILIPVQIPDVDRTKPDMYPIIDMQFNNGHLIGKVGCNSPIDTNISGLTLKADGIEQEFIFDPKTNEFTANLSPDTHKITMYAENKYSFMTVKSIIGNSEVPVAPFADTASHWAENTLGYMYSRGIISGDSTDGTLKFYPQKQMTRSEFAVMMVKYLGIAPQEYKDIQLPYSDFDQIPFWAVDSFKALYALDIMKGRYVSATETIADPSSTISRAETATLMSRILPEGIYKPDITATDKNDIAEWAKDGLATLIQIGAMKGYEDGSLKPNAPLTKAEAAKILYSIM